jgi:MFS family permease
MTCFCYKAQMQGSKVAIPLIVIAQFCCTSLWFASNAVMGDLAHTFQLEVSDLANLTTAVQIGFICGTLLFSVLMIPDRFPPASVFFVSALLGAAFNLCIILEGNSLSSLLGLRFATGFFLAGIYPVGMKIAADYREKGLGLALGYLVGALVLGTAFPHLLKGLTTALPWKLIILTTSGLALFGGLLIYGFVPNGPFRKTGQSFKIAAFFNVFQSANFRAAAFGYFGHMWELYTFWAFVPIILYNYAEMHDGIRLNIPILSFAIIGIGSLASVAAGYLSRYYGERETAQWALYSSALCAILFPLFFYVESPVFFIGYLCCWGIFVIADSPLFSALVAQHADANLKGTALTIVTCLGFSITIISIQLFHYLSAWTDSPLIYMSLAIGPILGLWALLKQ